MESSDLQQHHHHNHHHSLLNHQQHQQQQQPANSGLMRYRSAPSSYFNEMLDRELCQQFFNRPSSPETERIFARFMTSTDDLDPLKPPVTIPTPTPNPNLTPNPEPVQSSNNNYSAPPPPPATFYQSASKPPLPTSQAMNSGGEVPYSQRMNTQIPAMKTGLVRHSSSPAGLFANIDIDSGNFL